MIRALPVWLALVSSFCALLVGCSPSSPSASTVVDRPVFTRTLDFAGYTWRVKRSDVPFGPGPNIVSDGIGNVWVVDAGRLHLMITHRNDQRECAEVVLSESPGYGKYLFKLAERVGQLDPNVVLGLFTWDDAAPQHHYREIDIELSRWGEATGQNAQFVVQPWDHPGNRQRFDSNLTSLSSTHWFEWSPERILFASLQGRTSPPQPGDPIASWTYTGLDIPPAGGEHARINLWLLNGFPPIDGQEVEVVIEDFAFIPLEEVSKSQ